MYNKLKRTRNQEWAIQGYTGNIGQKTNKTFKHRTHKPKNVRNTDLINNGVITNARER